MYDKAGRFEDDGIWVSAFAPMAPAVSHALRHVWRSIRSTDTKSKVRTKGYE